MLNKNLKKFLEDKIELIETNNFNQLYKDAQTDLYFSQEIGTLTRALHRAGIDPLPHMEWIPFCYLYGDSNLTEYTIPDHIMFVESDAFANCNLKKVVFGQRVDVVFYGAFEGCSQLSEVELNDGLLEIGQYAFRGTDLTKLRLPKFVRSIDVQAFPELLTLQVYHDTYAESFAITNGYEVEYLD